MRRRTPARLVRQRLLAALVVVGALLLGGCAEAARLGRIVPHLLSPGAGAHLAAPAPAGPAARSAALPPEQPTEGFDFEPAGTDPQGRSLFQVRIGPGGNPYLVASSKLTPLFQVDGLDGPAYVAKAYFQANPGRTPTSIQPGDKFLLALPPQAFVVRSQQDSDENFGYPAHLREYVSERGDRLRFYLSDPFPIRYELLSADAPTRGLIHFHPDLAFLLGTGQIDLLRLTQLVYRVADPDIFQVEAMRRFAAGLQPGVEATLEVDRGRAYLDPVREALRQASRTEPVPEPDRAQLTRAVFSVESGSPYLAVEDGLGTHADLSELPDGRVFRIEYYWDGTVRVAYKTGENDGLGKRDPYQLRENERWAELYRRLLPNVDDPIKWGAGEPSDLEPFPTARDPRQRSDDPRHAYDYLVPGRALVLTFKPERFQSDLRAELEFRGLLGDLRERYRPQIDQAVQALETLIARDSPAG